MIEHVRFGQRDQLIVGVDGLRTLAGADRDRRQRRDQRALADGAFDQRQDGVVHRYLFVDLAAREEVVDAHRRKAFEEVLATALAELDLEARQIGQERVGERDGEGVFDNGIAVGREAILVFGQRHAGSVTEYGVSVRVLAIVELAGTIERAALALASALGTLAYQERLKLATGLPAVVLMTPDAGRAAALVDALAAHGQPALRCAAADEVAADDMVSLKRFAFERDALVASDGGERLPWGDVAALVRAIDRRRIESATIVAERSSIWRGP